MKKEKWTEALMDRLGMNKEKWTREFVLLLTKKTIGWLLMLAFYCVVGAVLMYCMDRYTSWVIYEPVQLGWKVGAVAWAVVLGYNIYGSTPVK